MPSEQALSQWWTDWMLMWPHMLPDSVRGAGTTSAAAMPTEKTVARLTCAAGVEPESHVCRL